MRVSPISIYISAILLLTSALCDAAIERRKDQFGKDFGYYVYPIVGEIPGLGSAAGGGASVLNIAGNDADFTGYYIQGDFEAKGAALLDYHLLPQRLIFDVGYNDYLVAPTSYDRGINSDPDDVIRPKIEGSYILGQLTYTLDERRYELFARALRGRNRLHEILDKDGKAFAGVDTQWKQNTDYALGGSVDLTDDRLDPRNGVRFEFAAKLPRDAAADESHYWVTDYNLSYYIPMRRWDTLAFNLFHSRTHVTRKGETDYATLQQTSGLNCSQYPVGGERDKCLTTEKKRINSLIAQNRYGTASPLGGTQRLRAFDNYRFYASQVLFYGTEYRWNLTDERTPFDIFIAKGIRTGMQLAAFWERGMVTDHSNELLKDSRSSYGIGFRVILSGVIIRLDLANGEEGMQSQLFITYPWSMFSVDNPG
ncbi:MAG: BamA/TamA family outer membrane protein [Gammaproteobacteria bacterium]|nr:BamA/TamA family outer membrane protein [Gammaproteobacteria bacterium]